MAATASRSEPKGPPYSLRSGPLRTVEPVEQQLYLNVPTPDHPRSIALSQGQALLRGLSRQSLAVRAQAIHDDA